MSVNQSSSIALFEKFRPKFREITWHPCGLAHNHDSRELWGRCMSSRISGTNFYLEPVHIGQKKPIEHIMNGKPCLNVEQAGLKFSVDFDAADGFANQFNEALWQAIQEGPLKGRRFFMDPVFKDGKLPTSVHSYTSAYVRITVEGGEVVGLDLAHNMLAYHLGWEAYIPPSPERQAIETALSLEDARAQHAESKPFMRVGELEGTLEGQLAVISS
ncbi:MAG: hypothetical protein WDZ93_01205 [Candidatus Paceibacterota bacterium]